MLYQLSYGIKISKKSTFFQKPGKVTIFLFKNNNVKSIFKKIRNPDEPRVDLGTIKPERNIAVKLKMISIILIIKGFTQRHEDTTQGVQYF